MAKIEIKEVQDKKAWEDFLELHPEANFLQSWYWGEFYITLNNKIYRKGFYKNGKLVGVMLALVENARRAKYLTVPGGPIIDWNDISLISAFVAEIKTIAKAEKCAFVRVRPQLVSDDFSKDIFAKNKFVNAPTHLHAELTSQIDVTKSEDELLAGMRKNTRYEVRKALSQNIEVAVTNEPSAIKEFYDIEVLTSRRQRFVPFSYEFLYEQFKVFANAGKALLYTAKLEGKLLAQAFIIFYGQEAVYHYGASTDEGRKHPGAYLIQWEVMREAKRRGMKRYNLWGVSLPEQTNHRFHGISIFKRGFGGTDFEYLHARDLIISYPQYIVNYVIESVRKRLRHV